MLTVVPTYALILDYPVLANPTPHASSAAIREEYSGHCGAPLRFPMLSATPDQPALAAWPALLQ